MREKPIIFSGPMVRAILSGRKTQTRRVAKPLVTINGEMMCPQKSPYEVGQTLWVREGFHVCTFMGDEAGYPVNPTPKENTGGLTVFFKADGGDGPWKPSIHMPRWASRITLEVVSVRCERLGEISEDDAIAEGVERDGQGFKSYETILVGPHKGTPHPHSRFPNISARRSFDEIWQSIHGEWNPDLWVWVYEFKVKDVKP